MSDATTSDTATSNTTITELDRIEREIEIAAPASKVWALISEPGWFINDKELTEHRIEHDGDLVIVHDPNHGRFAFRVVELDEPRYAAFRWHSDIQTLSAGTTLVEFWITEHGDGVTLKVAESGFASLDEPEVDRRSRFADHTDGWRIELDLARHALTAAVERG